ncbi:MAG: hypothetical protein MZW92_11600 [Comamonadaceae bacterium]|nr:hypothetical protein [Comamonadaceae bacterium]
MVGMLARDAGVGGDLAVLDGHVEVGADEHALALEIEIGHADDGCHAGSPWERNWIGTEEIDH